MQERTRESAASLNSLSNNFFDLVKLKRHEFFFCFFSMCTDCFKKVRKWGEGERAKAEIKRSFVSLYTAKRILIES
jgi:hypothetical protein